MKKLFFLLFFCLFCFANLGQTSSTAFAQDSITGKDLANAQDSTLIRFVGSGDIQRSVSDGENITANTGIGVSLYRTWGEDGDTKMFKFIEVDLSINVASTADTFATQINEADMTPNRRALGSFILLPINARQATSFTFDGYFKSKVKKRKIRLDGVHFKFVGANRVWSLGDQNSTVTALSFRLGLFYDFLPDDIKHPNEYAIKVGVNYTHRAIMGDLAFKEQDDFRKQLLGTTKQHFGGFEITFGIKLKNIKAEASIPMLLGPEVQGLARTQFVTSINFVGGFPLQIGGNSKK